MPWPTLHLTIRVSAAAVVTVALAAGVLPGRAAAAGLDGTVPIAPTGVRTCLALDEQLDRWPTPQPCAESGPLRVLPKQDGMPPARQLGYEAIAHYPLTECVRDKVTGQLRAPTAEEAEAMRASQSAARSARSTPATRGKAAGSTPRGITTSRCGSTFG